jgi:hypothetical protein
MRRYALCILITLCFNPAFAATLVGDTISYDRTHSSGYSWCTDFLGGVGCEVTVEAGNGDRTALSTGDNLYFDIDASNIFLEFGPGSGGAPPGEVSLLVFSDINATITGFSLTTDLSGLTASNISFTANEISVDYSDLTRSGGQFANLELTLVPIPAAVWLFGSALAGLGFIRRRKTV